MALHATVIDGGLADKNDEEEEEIKVEKNPIFSEGNEFVGGGKVINRTTLYFSPAPLHSDDNK
jgi:hypothetical protein